jgi:2,3-bisphosphoglycerate-independent phosphoglycerate mutase
MPSESLSAKDPKTSVVLIVLDGWGIAPRSKYNAISLAKTPNFDRIEKQYGSVELCASGVCVGLSAGQMGNSEVGHLTLGSGRAIFQDLMRVNQEIQSGRLAKNRDLKATFAMLAKSANGSLHLLGLVSNGGVHSHIDHLFALLRQAKDAGVRRINVHIILDGRDTPPKSGIDFVGALESYIDELGVGKIVTISGRYYAMDRDGRWERTKLAYEAIVRGKGEEFADPISAVKASYESNVTDEFVLPRVIEGYQGLNDGDAILFFNFRPDRARQITRALALDDQEFAGAFDRSGDSAPKNIEMLTMTVYDPSLKVKALLEREHVPNTLSDVLEKNEIKQLRIAETEKYAHVTYFFNGLSEPPKNLEDRILVPSAREVGTYDKKPEMSAKGITSEALKAIKSQKYGFILINYANADMVGHSGNVAATIRAVEAVDSALGEVESALNDIVKQGKRPPVTLVTADHGNAEKMFDEATGQPHTAHTSNPVPLVLISKNWKLNDRENFEPGLVDVAPSILAILGLAKPRDMTGRSIVERSQ